MSLLAPHPAPSFVSPELTPLSDHEWRVIDTSCDPDDAASVLGFVERMLDGQFEVIVLGPGHGINRLLLSSLDEVTAHFLSR